MYSTVVLARFSTNREFFIESRSGVIISFRLSSLRFEFGKILVEFSYLF